jgi:hypothetical protein
MGAKGKQSMLSDPGAAVVAASAQNPYGVDGGGGMDGSDMANAQVAMNPYTFEASPPGIGLGPPGQQPFGQWGAMTAAEGYPPSAYGTPGTTPYPQTQGTPGYEPANPMNDPMGERQQPGAPIEWTDPGSRPVPGADKKGIDWKKILEGAQEGLRKQPPFSPSSIPSVPGLSAAQYGTPDAKLGPFLVMPFQSRILRSMGMNDEQGRSFLANQIMAGNPQYGPYSAQQIGAAQRMFGGGGRG